MTPCIKCNTKLCKTNCFYLYTLFRKTKTIKPYDENNILICDKCYDKIDDEDEKIEYLNKLDEKYYYGYSNEFNIKHLNHINNSENKYSRLFIDFGMNL